MTTLTLISGADVTHALGAASWLGRPSFHSVHVAIPAVDAAERDRLARRIHYLFNDCGCFVAAPVAAGVAVVGGLGLVVGHLNLLTALAVFGFAVVSGVVAKLAALAWSAYRLRSLLRGLAARTGP